MAYQHGMPPYRDGYEQTAFAEMQKQADVIVTSLKSASIKTESDREIIALIAYLQRLGTDIKPTGTALPNTTMTSTSN